jgi:hypothetical protein
MAGKEILQNQYGEVSINTVLTGSNAPLTQAQVQASPAKTGVTALSALAGGATLADVIVQCNALLAAMKAIV